MASRASGGADAGAGAPGTPLERHAASGPNKRKRVALACGNCRSRKTRCDGRRPKCSLCEEMACECQYEQSGTTTSLTVGRSYLERLEHRLGDIESSLQQLRDGQGPSPAGTSASSSNYREQHGQSIEVNAESTDSGDFAAANYGSMGDIDTVEDPIDGMGAIKFTDEEDWGYFGPSSNIAFLRYISLAMARVGNWNRDFHSPSNKSYELAGGVSVSRPRHAEDEVARRRQYRLHPVNIYALPSEERTWTLVQEYFQKTGQLLPFVHEESFSATYFEMKRSNFTEARRTWLGLLNIILAMATTLFVEETMTAEERIEESDVYYQRATGLCDRESTRNISLELVQYLLILGQYLQGTQKSVQAWTVHGLAITTAFQLGLHSPKTNKRFPLLESEIRKRAWLGCMLLDRTLSMTFGRPSMIPEGYLKLELPDATIRIVGQSRQPPSTPQMDATFYTATVTLYNIMYQIIDSCYGQNLGLEENRADSKLVSVILKGEEQLDEWQSSLVSLRMFVYNEPMRPQNLQSMEPRNKITERFFIVLSVRYHNLQILLHRPMLEKFLDACGRGSPSATGPSKASRSGRGMAQYFGISSIEKCISSAVVVISIVRTVVLSEGWRRDLLGAWNYSLFYTFNAGLAIFAAAQVARQDYKDDPGRAAQWAFVETTLPYFNMAVEALENLDRGNRVVQRCVSYLSQLPIEHLNSSPTSGPPAEIVRRDDTQPFRPINGLPGPGLSRPPSARAPGSGIGPRQASMEIDLNEFMLDTDLDLFGRNFDMA